MWVSFRTVTCLFHNESIGVAVVPLSLTGADLQNYRKFLQISKQKEKRFNFYLDTVIS